MTCTFTSIAESIAADAKRLEDDLKKADARADLNQRELDRVCIERASERNRADAAELERERLRAEVARLTVAKLPTADDYSRLISERNDARADLGIARGNVETLREKVEALSSAWHKHRAEITEQRARADAADLEVARLREALDSARNLAELRGQEVTKWANAAGVARGERQLLRDEVARLTTAVETATADAALAEATIVGLEKERDAARAELARVREALNTLASAVTCEGKKGGGS